MAALSPICPVDDARCQCAEYAVCRLFCFTWGFDTSHTWLWVVSLLLFVGSFAAWIASMVITAFYIPMALYLGAIVLGLIRYFSNPTVRTMG